MVFVYGRYNASIMFANVFLFLVFVSIWLCVMELIYHVFQVVEVISPKFDYLEMFVYY